MNSLISSFFVESNFFTLIFGYSLFSSLKVFSLMSVAVTLAPSL